MSNKNYYTFVFGNGINRAVDNRQYDLGNACKKILEGQESSIIQSLLPPSISDEKDFSKLTQALTACSILNDINNDYLSGRGKELYSTASITVHSIAKSFCMPETISSNTHYMTFVNSLVRFCEENDTHIATLNYDTNLYLQLVEKKLLNGYQHRGLVDGFWEDGFNSENMERTHTKFGWYLHLHGSALFYESSNQAGEKVTSKCNGQFTTPGFLPGSDCLVLGPTQLKPYLILKSSILDTYWSFFKRSLFESCHIILFGYSGEDDHVNREIKLCLSLLAKDGAMPPKISIVEFNMGRLQNDQILEREMYWRARLVPEQYANLTKLRVFPLENILQFDFGILKAAPSA